MNPLPNKNERDAFDKGLPATLTGRNEQKSDALSLSGKHAQPVPFFNIAGQFGAKLVQYAKPGVSKKVLAAMAEDPDPAASLANIRKLLVGPTHKLHDAMFEEVVTILEESDREVQNSLRALESRCVKLSHTTNELVPLRWKAGTKIARRLNFCKRKSKNLRLPSRKCCPRCFW